MLVAITASLIVHLLVISTYERWATDEVTQVLLPVRMDPAPTMAEPDRFRSSAPRRLPRAARERLRRETALPPLSTPLPSADEPPLPDLPELTIRTDDVLKARGKGSLPTAAALDLHEQMMEAFRRKKAQRDRRSLYALPDADTTDQDDRGHGLAEAIIDSAIAAMGGLERLQAVTDKTVQVWFYDSEKQEWERTEKRYFWRGLRFREDIRRAIARGFDGQRSWYSRFGVNLPAPDLSGKAERWDFLSRYKGDGILLNTYFLEEFKAAGIAAEGEEVRWLETVIERYFVGSNHQLIFTVTLRDMSDRGWVWSEKMEYVWRPLKGAIAINDEVGTAITLQLLTRVAFGLTVLLDLPPAADTPTRTQLVPAAAP